MFGVLMGSSYLEISTSGCLAFEASWRRRYRDASKDCSWKHNTIGTGAAMS